MNYDLHCAYLKRNIRVFVEKHVKLTDAYSQITVCELVRNVETKGSKFTSL